MNMDTLEYLEAVTKATKTKKMLWKPGAHEDFYTYYNSNEYKLNRDVSGNIRLIVNYGYKNKDQINIVDPYQFGPISKLYLVVEILTAFNPN